MIPKKIYDQASKIPFAGDFIILELYRRFIKSKRSLRVNSIIIKPGRRIERPRERNNEHIYYVVEGIGKIDCPELQRTITIEPFSLIYIPVALKHIIINHSIANLHIIDFTLIE